MSYICQPDRPTRGHRYWHIAVAVAVALAATGLYLLGRGAAGSTSTPPATATPTAADQISWSQVAPPPPPPPPPPPTPPPAGLAAGFSHDALGAVLAAFNITYRLSCDAAPMVTVGTARDQTFGDIPAELADIAAQPRAGSTPGTEFFYKILAGDPVGDSVLISLAEHSNETAAVGGYFTIQRSLRWENGDWRMAVPMPAGQLMASLPGYQRLGSPHV